jgi:hypothetical protein
MNGLAGPLRLRALVDIRQETGPGPSAAAGSSPPARAPRWLFPALQLYMAAVVFIGFAPSFYLKPERALAMHPVIHVHAAIMTLWIVFMAVQGVLPSRGRIKLHRTLGWFGVGLAALVLVSGVMIAGQGVRDGWDPFKLGSGEAFAAIPFRDLATFSTFLAVGLWTRKRAPEAHKRLMTLATLSVIPAALGRLAAFTPEPVIVALNHAPMVAMVVCDLVTRRRVLTSTWLGSAYLIAATPLCLALAKTEAWQDFVRALT